MSVYLAALSGANALGQAIVVFIIFIFVLVITTLTTKWIANFQKEKSAGENIVILESKRIAPNKLIEIVRIGDKCYALAVGKDEVTLIDEISSDSLKYPEVSQESFSFREILKKVRETGEDETK